VVQVVLAGQSHSVMPVAAVARAAVVEAKDVVNFMSIRGSIIQPMPVIHATAVAILTDSLAANAEASSLASPACGDTAVTMDVATVAVHPAMAVAVHC
jgi:hypothetical protein